MRRRGSSKTRLSPYKDVLCPLLGSIGRFDRPGSQHVIDGLTKVHIIVVFIRGGHNRGGHTRGGFDRGGHNRGGHTISGYKRWTY